MYIRWNLETNRFVWSNKLMSSLLFIHHEKKNDEIIFIWWQIQLTINVINLIDLVFVVCVCVCGDDRNGMYYFSFDKICSVAGSSMPPPPINWCWRISIILHSVCLSYQKYQSITLFDFISNFPKQQQVYETICCTTTMRREYKFICVDVYMHLVFSLSHKWWKRFIIHHGLMSMPSPVPTHLLFLSTAANKWCTNIRTRCAWFETKVFPLKIIDGEAARQRDREQ